MLRCFSFLEPDGKSYVVVAVYTKPGNIDGQFRENVEKGSYYNGSSGIFNYVDHS